MAPLKSVCMIVQSWYDADARVRRKADALVEAGYSVDVLALRGPGGKKSYTVKGVNIRTLSLGKHRGSLPRYAFEYAAFFLWTLVRVPFLMRRRRYAVIDVNTLPDFLVFAPFLARWMGAKLLLDMHEITAEFYQSKYGISEESWVIRMLKYLEKASFNFADRVVTINEPIQDLLASRGLPRSKSTVVMNSADESRFAAESGASRDRRASPRSEKFVMMYHGTLTRIYGLDIAIQAFSQAHDKMPGAELWILGSGPEAGPLSSLVERHGLSSKVKLIGQVPSADIPQWLDSCSVGILPIRRDVFLDYAFPNKLPECIVTGKAVIVSRLRAIRHYFSEDAVAYFEPNNPTDLADMMLRLHRDPRLRARLASQASREYAAIRWEVMKQRYLALVDEMANPKRRSTSVKRRPSAALLG
jgi:glycosyltransferase involved in cell wall biosynthesis